MQRLHDLIKQVGEQATERQTPKPRMRVRTREGERGIKKRRTGEKETLNMKRKGQK